MTQREIHWKSVCCLCHFARVEKIRTSFSWRHIPVASRVTSKSMESLTNIFVASNHYSMCLLVFFMCALALIRRVAPPKRAQYLCSLHLSPSHAIHARPIDRTSTYYLRVPEWSVNIIRAKVLPIRAHTLASAHRKRNDTRHKSVQFFPFIYFFSALYAHDDDDDGDGGRRPTIERCGIRNGNLSSCSHFLLLLLLFLVILFPPPGLLVLANNNNNNSNANGRIGSSGGLHVTRFIRSIFIYVIFSRFVLFALLADVGGVNSNRCSNGFRERTHTHTHTQLKCIVPVSHLISLQPIIGELHWRVVQRWRDSDWRTGGTSTDSWTISAHINCAIFIPS